MSNPLEHRGTAPRARPNPEAVRDLHAVALTVATGATDAISITRLGGVFTSVMTGNLVLLGVSGGRREGSLALHAGTAILGYVIGALIGAWIAGHPTSQQSIWPRTVTVALAVELALFLAFTVGWELAGGHPSGGSTYVLIGCNATALGIQSSAVLRLGVPGMSTTYLTGLLTQLVSSLTLRRRPSPNRSLAIVFALVAGAGVGALLSVEVPRAAPAAPVLVLAAVLAGTRAIPKRDPAPQ